MKITLEKSAMNSYRKVGGAVRGIFLRLCLLTLFIVSCVQTQATVRYVKAGGAGAKTGVSWAAASDDLQQMINISNAGDTVFIAAGTYYPTHTADGWTNANPTGVNGTPTDRKNAFVMKSGVKIYGGFPANADDINHAGIAARDWATNTVTLSGDINKSNTSNSGDACHVVIAAGTQGGATLDGVTVSGGYAMVANYNVTVNGITVSSNNGGGIVVNGVMTFANITVTGNSARNNGGGIYISGGHPIFTNITVTGNTIMGGNSNGGGVYADLSNAGTVCYMTNATIVNNSATSGYGGGIYCNGSNGTFYLRNSIVWGNASGSNNISGAITHNHNLVQGGTVSGTGIISNSNPNLNADYTLPAGSPAIDIGNNTLYLPSQQPNLSGITTDLAGNPRIQNGQVDLGAYEYTPPTVPTPDKNCILYVREGAKGDGSSWANAYGNLADPLEYAYKSKFGCKPVEIWVAAGTYYPMYAVDFTSADPRDMAFLLVEGVKIYGGFNPANPESSPGLRETFVTANNVVQMKYTTLLSGDIDKDDVNGVPDNGNTYHVVVGAGALTPNNTLLDGVTVSGGNGNVTSDITVNTIKIHRNDGGGIHLTGGASPTLSRLVVSGNMAGVTPAIADNTGAGIGGGIYVEQSAPVMTEIQILGNTSHEFGGGMQCVDCSKISITGAEISGNTAYRGGGIYFMGGGSLVMTGAVVSGNTTKMNVGDAGGILINGTLTLTNVQITGNASNGGSGGGILMYNNGNSYLTNVTVAGNYAKDPYSGIFIVSGSSGTMEVRNSIIYDNNDASGSNVNINNINVITFHSSLVEGMSAAGIISSADPQFVAPDPVDPAVPTVAKSGGDYRLLITSPAVNAGDALFYGTSQMPDLSGITTDLAGKPRIQDCGIDLGAYETQPVVPGAGGIVYVREGATGDGSSWANAYGNLADPLAFAAKATQICNGTVQQIWVAAGTYCPIHAADFTSTDPRDRAFLLVDGVKIYGGFNPANPESDPALRETVVATGAARQMKYATVLSGDIGNPGDNTDNAYHVVMVSGAMGDAVLDGFTVSGGYADGAGTITVNSNQFDRPYGAGITVRNGGMIFSNLKITNNTASAHGGGMYLYNSSNSSFTNITVDSNTASSGSGGGLYLNSGSPVFTNITFDSNTSGALGGGMYLTGGNSTFTNVLTVKNTTQYFNGGGIYMYDGTYTVTNATIAENEASDGGGIYYSGGTFKLLNSIVWGNTASNGVSGIYGTKVSHDRNLVQDATVDGVNIISNADPLFNATGDYSLKPASPAIDRGNSSYNTTGEDLAGNPRKQGCEIDLGAYETVSVAAVKPDAGGIVYVTETGDGDKDGSSWANAYPGLADPLHAAAAMKCIQEIWVADGTYLPEYIPGNGSTDRDKTFLLVAGVKVYGGFTQVAGLYPAPPSAPPFGTTGRDGVSVLSGDIGITNDSLDNVYHVVMAVGAMGDAELDGFTVSGGNSANNIYGAGIVVSVAGDMKFSNITVTGNVAFRSGGGISVQDGTPVFTDVTVSNNTSLTEEGGGIFIRGGDPVFTNVTVSGNKAAGGGGGIHVSGGDPVFTNVTVTNNTALVGAGICIDGGNPVFTNILIVKNNSDYNSGGVYNGGGGTVYMTNATIADNTVTPIGIGIGIGLYGGIANDFGTLNLRNSIVWGNTANGNPDNIYNSGTLNHANNLVEGGPVSGTGIILDADPRFVASASGDYRLTACSPAINMGDKNLISSAVTTDLAGNPRIYNVETDLGAYEYQGDPSPFTINPDVNGIVYVTEYGNGLHDGSSWANAYSGLADPLYAAANGMVCGGTVKEIWVADGTYYPEYIPAGIQSDDRYKTFVPVKDVKVYGGFIEIGDAGYPTTLLAFGAPGRNGVSILSGDTGNSGDNTDNVFNVVISAGAMGDALFDGFTVSGGYSVNANNVIYQPVTTVNDTDFPIFHGAGVTVAGDMKFSNITVNGNEAFRNGGGIYVQNGNPVFTDVTVSNNTSLTDGGGIFIRDGNPDFTNVTVSGNTATDTGGGISIYGGNPDFTNILIVKNSANDGGGGVYNGFSINTGTVNMTNATVADNTAVNSGYSGGIMNDGGTLNLSNSVIWGNTANGTPDNIYNSGTLTHDHNLVQGGPVSGTGIILDADPKFAGAGNYHLTMCSPAVNAGDNALYTVSAPDLDGATRIQHGTIDLGAYEYQGALPSNIQPAAGIVYVRDGGTGTQDGSSWDNAYPNLADPLKAAANGTVCDAIEQIWVAAGTYYPMYAANFASSDPRDRAFLLVNGVKIYGGFDPDNPESNPALRDTLVTANNVVAMVHHTILSGDIDGNGALDNGNAYHVVVGTGPNISMKTYIDGLTVVGGNANGWGELWIDISVINRNRGGGICLMNNINGRVTMSKVAVSGNRADVGGGIHGFYTPWSVTDGQITGNTATSGGGINNMSPATISNTLISDNTANDIGGGIYSSYSITLTGVTLAGNTALQHGGGMYTAPDNARVTNTLISGNTALKGGGIYGSYNNKYGLMTLINTTVAGNYAADIGGGIVFGSSTSIAASSGTLYNSIVYGNRAGNSDDNLNDYSTVVFGNSLVEDITQAGIITQADPKFAAADYAVSATPTSGGDYRLLSGSPAIDAGNDSYNATPLDLAGNSRTQGCAIDLGAYETTLPALFAGINPDNAGIVYVRTDGTGDGSSWANAYHNLADPLAAAQMKPCIKQIWVAAGTYYPMHIPTGATVQVGATLNDRDKTFPFVNGVKVYGGFVEVADAGYPTTLPAFGAPGRDGLSTLSGDIGILNDSIDNVFRVVTVAGATDNALLDGFTVSGGYSSYVFDDPQNTEHTITVNGISFNPRYGAGIAVNGDMSFSNITVTGNSLGIGFGRGGGISVTGGNPTFTDITVSDNTVAIGWGGGIFVSSGNPVFTGITVSNHTMIEGWGGGISVIGGNPVFTNVRVSDNTIEINSGGGIYVSSGNPVFTNLIVSGNTAESDGGGITLTGGTSVFTNVTVSGNSNIGYGGGIYAGGTSVFTNVTVSGNTGYIGGGIYVDYGTTINLSNSVVWGNTSSNGTTDNIYLAGSGSGINHHHNLVEGATLSGTEIISVADPLFVGGGDYHLTACSPAINVGDNALNTAATDLDGAPRKYNNGTIDLGAYEFQGDPPASGNIRPAAGIVYVRDGGTGTKDGSSWDNAYPNLADPLKAAADGTACGTVEQIWVAAGTYYPMHIPTGGSVDRDKTFLLAKDVKVYGGFTETAPGNVYPTGTTPPAFGDPGAGREGESILSGDIGITGSVTDNAFHVVMVAGNMGDALLDGFTVSGGYGYNGSSNINGILHNRGAGIAVAGNMHFSNITVKDNEAGGNGAGAGAGIYLHSGNSTFTDITVTGNKVVQNSGGGIFINNGTHTFTDITVSNNKADDGGGIFIDNGNHTFTGVAVTGNEATATGAGIYLQGSAITSFTNILVAKNFIDDEGGAGGIQVYGNGTHTITNATIADNSNKDSGRGAGIEQSGGTLNLSNSIIWRNMRDGVPGNITGTVNHDHNLLQGGTPDGAFIVSSKDPEFVSAATGDYRLTACSPAINIGNDGLNSASTDLDGASRRYNGGIIDLGAYEYQGDPPTFSTVKPSSAGIVYVRTDGNGDGSSWDSAYPNLADPLKAAADGSACGTVQQIWVAAGTYYPMHKAGNGTQDRDKTFLLVDGVKIYGGFTKTSGNVYPTGATPPAFGADGRKGGSILSGDIGKNDGGGTKTDNAYHVVLGAGTLDNTTTVLDGFTITGGVANVSGNIMVNSVTNIMRNSGGGVYLKSNASPVLTNLVITGNTVSRLGCMYIDSSSPTLTGVKITGNEAYQGGGINTNSSSPNLTNVQITGNKTSSQGGGIYNSSSSPILVNVTIAGNSANNGGGGIYHSGSATLNIRNSIIWGNTAGNGVSGIYGTNVIHDHNLVQDATVDGVNIISAADPMFVAPESASSAPTAAGDYRLTKCSPAINAGDNTQNSTATDLDGAPRKYNNGTIDLGAYEYQGDPLTGNNLIKPDVNGIVYVIEGGDGNGDGSSWENAYPNLADPLKAAVISGTACRTVKEIWVAAGTYYPAHLPPVGYGLTDRDKTFLIVDGVKIYGGFTPVISTGKYPTGATPPAFGDDGRKGVSTLSGDIDKDGIHDADNVYHVVAASCSQGNSLLDGFTVSGGYSTGWNSGKVDVFERYCGAGIVVKGDMTFSNITVTGNMARHGGGIYVYGGNSIFTDITVSNNTTDEGSNGGGIYIAGGKPVVTNITVYDNSAGNCGGGMFLGKLDNAAVFTNILIFKNTAGNLGGGGIFLFEGTYYMTNLTVADNITRGNMGAGICLNGGALNLYLRNSVVWGNSTSGSTVNLLTNIYGSMVYYDHCLVQSISPGTSGIVSTADPEFADPAADDYRLTRCSPAINAGENSHNTYPTDLDHNPRIYDGITDQIDLGAYEYQGDPATGNVIKPDGNGIVYVIAGATGGDGSSWAKAYGNLADPLLAAANGTACRTVKEIWVAAGTYYPMHVPENPGVATTDRDKTFLLVDGVKIYGGFTKTSGNVYPTTLPAFGDEGRNGLSTLSGDFDQNDTGDPYGDALAGLKNDNVYHVVTGAGTLNGASLLDGFTLTGGYAGGSGSITVNTVSGISRNSGGGVYLKSGASPVLTNLVITGNISDSYGGGIYVESSSPALSRVKITGNGGMGHGGGMYNTDSSPVLTNVQITGNVANNFGGGMYNSNSSPVLTGVTVSGNRANSSSNTIGSGIHHAGSGTTQLLNSIVWGNTSSDGFDMYVENPANVLCSYSMVGKVRAGNNFTFAGILSSNIPQFESYVPATATVPVSGGDYRLKLTSPLIDIGNDTYVSGISTDLAGNARIQGCGVDLGAYETPPANIVPSSGRVYIRTNGVGDGSSWTDAYSNLSVALSRAKCIGITEIWVAAGTYVPETPILHTGDKAFTNDNTFLLVNGVKIYGGFNATAPESALDHRDTITVNGIITEMVNKTVLSGDLNGDDDQPGGDQSDNAFHVVTGFMTLDPATTVLDGFTVTGGVADAYLLGTGSAKLNFPGTNNYYGLERGAGGGIYLAHGASLRLNNLVITGNTADAERNHNGQGGGIYNHLSSPVINSVQITDNAAELGGGMYNSNNSSPVMTRTEISGNTAARDGGGIFNYASGSSSTLTNGFITGNTASRGGGVMNEGGSSTLTNVLIVGNSATGTDLNFQNGDGGGGIRNNGGSSTLINVTLTGNEATVKGGGICGSGVTLRNTIIWGNTAPANPDMTNDPSVCSYSLLPPAFSSVPGVISTSDPLFVSAGSDYRLQPASPGVNTGYNGHNHTDTDLDGNPRIFGGIIDLGAFETQEEPVLITAVNDTALTTVNTPVLIGVLDNDDLGTCGANPDFDIVAGPAHGIATFDTDTLIYTPNTGHYGIDSLDYEFGCDGKTVQARVYILTLKPLSNEYRACPNASVTMGFAEIPDVQYDWFESDGTTPSTPSSGATITRTKDNTGNPEVWYARAVWKGITFPLYRVTLNPAADVKPAVADIRLTLCPQLPRTVYLTALLDSLPYASAVQWTAVGASPVPADAATGELNTAAFPDLGTFTYTYNRISECATSSATAKAYVHIAHGKIPPRHDTVAICREQASAINISAIFGFELNGAPASTNASAYTATTSLNAVIFDGDKAYADNAGTAVVYRGTPAQAFDFTYAVSSPCSPTGTRKIVIVITE